MTPPTAEAQSAAYVQTSKKWPNPENIPVCWENWAADNLGKKWVRAAVEKTYEHRADFLVNFTGWGTCGPKSKGIRIKIEDSNLATSGLGTSLDGKKNGMKLNFTFNNFSKEYCQASPKTEMECIKTVAVHEFAHALGMAHEHNRKDTPDSCKEDSQGSNGNKLVGPWDIDSVTNYCNPNWGGDGILSEGDVKGLAVLYPHPQGKAARNVYYRDFFGNIAQLYKNGRTSWNTASPSAIARAPMAFGDPDALTYEDSENVFYRNVNGRISQLYWNRQDGWRHAEIGAIPGAPAAAGNPKAASLPGHISVFYRSTSNEFVQLWWTRSSGWKVNNLGARGYPRMKGDPSPYTFGHTYQIAYVDDSDQVIHVDWEAHLGWTHVVLSSAPASGKVSAFANGIWQYMYFRGTDNNVYQYWKFYTDTDWKVYNLSNATGAPIARGEVSANPYYRTHHVFYRNSSNEVSQLWWTAKTSWAHAGIGRGATPIAGDPVSIRYSDEQHVYYRDFNYEVQLLHWQRQRGWSNSRLGAWLNTPSIAGDLTVSTF